jgi:hypothetical protein
VTCPQGKTSAWWTPATQRGTDVIVVKYTGEHLPTVSGQGQVHHRHPRRAAVDPTTPAGPASPRYGPSRTDHHRLAEQVCPKSRCGVHDRPGDQGHRHPPGTLPRTGQDQPRP